MTSTRNTPGPRTGKVGCDVPICPRRHETGGYCRPHYKQMQRHGRITSDVIAYRARALPEETRYLDAAQQEARGLTPGAHDEGMSFRTFYRSELVDEYGARVNLKSVWQAYNDWCDLNHVPKGARIKRGKVIEGMETLGKLRRSGGVFYLRGLRFRTED